MSFTAEELKLFPGNILTHNHPSGGSFSWEDIQIATLRQLAEIRAVGSQFAYSAKPARGGSWPEIVKTFEAYETARSEVYWDTIDKVRSGRMTDDEANLTFWHTVWSRVSARMGFRYARRKR